MAENTGLGEMNLTKSAFAATVLALALTINPALIRAADAEGPVFCPLSLLGLGEPDELKPRRPIADECLFRASDRRLYIEIKPITAEAYAAVEKAGRIEALPEGAHPISDEKAEVEGRAVFVKTFAVRGQNQPRFRMVAVTKFGDMAVETTGVVQMIKLAGFGLERFRKTVLSTTRREPLTPDQFKAELPIWIDEFADFTVVRATNTSVFLGPGEKDPRQAGNEIRIHISLPFTRSPEQPTRENASLSALLEEGLGLDPSRTVEMQDIVERDGLKWYEFRAAGKAEGFSEPVFAYSAIRLELKKRVVVVQALMPLPQRALFEERLRTLSDNISWK